MVKSVPEHLFNQPIAVISGSTTYDEYGMETFGYDVLTSGTGRLQYSNIRTVTEDGINHAAEIRFFTSPIVSGTVGNTVEIDSTKYKIAAVAKRVDGRGIERLRIFELTEVSE